MTRIDFYVLPDAELAAQARFACRLAYKAWQQNHRVYVHTDDADSANALDVQMWVSPRDSFLPHELWQPGTEQRAPVLIGHGVDPLPLDDVLINLTAAVPSFFERFARVAEIVVLSPPVRSAGRERFRFYRERGYPLHHHDMKDWTDE